MKGEEIYRLVEKVLSVNQDARNDDRYLIFQVLKLCDVPGDKDSITLKFDKLDSLPSFESIRRFRQRIQNQELRYLPSWGNVLVRRGFSENEVRCIFGDYSETYQNYVFIKTEGARTRPA